MKIVNEKGKLFGIINIADLIIIVAVLLIGGAIVWQLVGDKVSDAVAPQEDLTAVVVVAGAHPDLVEEVLRQDLVGEKLVGGNEFLPATITDVWVENYVKQVADSNAVFHDSVDPSQKNICFRISAKVAPNTASPKIGAQEVRTGTTFIVKTQTFTCIGNIYFVQIGELTQEDEQAIITETNNKLNIDVKKQVQE